MAVSVQFVLIRFLCGPAAWTHHHSIIKTELHRVVNSQTQKKCTFGFDLIDCKYLLLWLLLNPGPLWERVLFCLGIRGISRVTF